MHQPHVSYYLDFKARHGGPMLVEYAWLWIALTATVAFAIGSIIARWMF
jgi:hypothetical protein